MDEKAQALTKEVSEKLAGRFKHDDPYYQVDVIAAIHRRVLDYTRYMNRVRPDRSPWTVSIWGQLIGKLIGAVAPPDDFWQISQGNVYKYIGLKGWYQLRADILEAAKESDEAPPGNLDLPEWLLEELKTG